MGEQVQVFSKPVACELCDRLVVKVTKHFIIPDLRRKAKGPTADLCLPCHEKLHSLFTNRELIRICHDGTLRDLRGTPQVNKFIKWLRSKNLPDVQPHSKGGVDQ